MMSKARVQKRLYYKIGEACKLLEIQPYVLRYWETEFPALSPSKSRSGQRVYSEAELDVIRRIKQLLYEEGYTIAGAKKKLESELDAKGEVRPAEIAADAAVETGQGDFVPVAAPPAPAVAPPPETLDTPREERVETLRSGIARALGEARSILALLDGSSPPRNPRT
jgi:DNA-binding transcriptional MerR regulator